MKTLLFKMRGYITEENRFGHRTWDELPSSIVITAGYLSRQGHDIEVLDSAAYDDAAFAPYDAVAGWVSIADGLYEGLDYLRVAKKLGKTTILVLFDDWDDLSRQILEDYPFVDYAIRRWDTETSLENLLSHLRDGTDINPRGLVVRKDGIPIDGGDGLFHDGPLDHLKSARAWIERLDPSSYDEYSIRVGSGCPFKCTFCHIGRRPNRYRPIDALIDELSALPRNAFVRLLSADLPADKEWATRFAEAIVDAKIDVRWETDSRFTWLGDVEFLKLLRRSGCEELAMGLESYHPEILNAYKKGYKHELIDIGLRNLVEVGIRPGLNMMIGNPHETTEHLQYTTDFLRRLDPRKVHLIGIQYLRPLPGTKAYGEATKLGLFPAKYSYRDFFRSRDYPMLPTLSLQPEEIVGWRDKMYEAYKTA